MPKWWYDNTENQILEGDTEEVVQKKLLNQRICADKKPYFFIYNYQSLMTDYKSHLKKYNSKSLREFSLSLDELLSLDNPTEEQKEVIKYYYKDLPVNQETCLVNEICYAVEKAFEEPKKVKVPFDYTILKSGAKYTNRQKFQIMQIYTEFTTTMYEQIKSDPSDVEIDYLSLYDIFKIKCFQVAGDEKVICDILLDIGYTTNKAKSFIWNLFGDVIIDNLLSHTDNYGYVPIADPSGDIEYCGEKFSMKKIKMKGDTYGNYS